MQPDDSYYGGEPNARRVADICAEAHRLLALGRQAEEALSTRLDCRTVCKFPDGQPRFVRSDGKISHHCGR